MDYLLGNDARFQYLRIIPSRMEAEWQAGDWFVDRNAAWTEPLVEQLTMFPNARNDDMADMMSQASAWALAGQLPDRGLVAAFDNLIWPHLY
jgi:hypothetical protein